jgi:Ca-activated chloride channel family protein
MQLRARFQTQASIGFYGLPVRGYEYFNYYDFAYPPAPAGELALHAAMLPVDGAEAAWTLQFAVSSETRTNAERAPMTIALVLDTSGSMSGHRLAMLKESCRAIAAQLGQGDRVSLVSWNSGNNVLLDDHPVAGPNDVALLAAINSLEASGGTDLHAGLVKGYELVEASFQPGRIHRLVLVSDGGANLGVIDEALIAKKAAFGGPDAVYMVGVGVGAPSDGYNDLLMDTVTDAGKGAAVFVSRTADAWDVFGARFVNTMDVAARDVQVELVLPPGFEISKFSGEEFGEDPQEIEAQHIAPNDAIVFHQQIETCAPELVDDETPITIRARWVDAITLEDREVTRETTFGELLGADPTLLLKGRALQATIDVLQDASKYKPIDPTAANAAITEALAMAPGDPQLIEWSGFLSEVAP